MTEFRRLISYIYEYEGKVKGKNVGFAKLETRNGLCKLNVSVKKLYMGSGSLGVYLLSARREIFLGNMFLRNGGGEFRTVIQAADVEQSGEKMDDCYGLTIHDKKDSWKVYTTIWEDSAAQAAELAAGTVMEEKTLGGVSGNNLENGTEDILGNVLERGAGKRLGNVFENAADNLLGSDTERGADSRLRSTLENVAESLENSSKDAAKTILGTVSERIIENVAENSLENTLENTAENVPKNILENNAEGRLVNRTEIPNNMEKNGCKVERLFAEDSEKEMEAGDFKKEIEAGDFEKKIEAEDSEKEEEKEEEFHTEKIHTEKTLDKKENIKTIQEKTEEKGEKIPRNRINNNPMPQRRPQGHMFFNLRQQPAPIMQPIAPAYHPQPSASRAQQAGSGYPTPTQQQPVSRVQPTDPGYPAPAQQPTSRVQPTDPGYPAPAQQPTSRVQPTDPGYPTPTQQPSASRVQPTAPGAYLQQPVSAVHTAMEKRNPAPFREPPRQSSITENPQPVIRQHEEEPLIIGDPEALAKLEEEEKMAPVPLWDFLSKTYPKIQAFESQYGCEILVIKPQDIGLLPREVWIYGNNSFLLHGYYNYRYLILARLENPHGSPRYLLGVPGHYYSNEKYMASMFGFPNFVLSKKQQSQDGRFGYWYTDVRLGDGNVASAVVRHSQMNMF